MIRVVITGATSFIGANLINEYIKEKCEIYAVVRPKSKNLYRIANNNSVNIIELDMRDYGKLVDYIGSADVFIHLAWEGTRMPYRDDSTIQNFNLQCAIKAIESAHYLGCSTFLGVGSQAEYGKMDSYVKENASCTPVSEYGKKKLEACRELEKMAERYNIRFIWTRLFSIYGKYDYQGTLIMSMIDKMKKDEVVELTACTQLWDFLNVKDAVSAIIMLVKYEDSCGIYNVASGIVHPLKKYVIEIKEIINSNSELKFGAIPYSKEGPLSIMPDVCKLKEIGWEPKVDFRDGIRQI